MKKVLKYATGEEIPEGAVYLWSCKNGEIGERKAEFPRGYKFVWHYFLVEVKD